MAVRLQQVRADGGLGDVELRVERGLEQDDRVVGVDEGGAGHLHAQPAPGGPAVDPVVRVRRVVDEAAALLEPGVDGVPGHLHVARRLRHRLVREVADDVGGERVGQRVPGAVHERGPPRCRSRCGRRRRASMRRGWGSTYTVPGGIGGENRPAGSGPERASRGGEGHIAVRRRRRWSGSAKARTMASTVNEASRLAVLVVHAALRVGHAVARERRSVVVAASTVGPDLGGGATARWR